MRILRSLKTAAQEPLIRKGAVTIGNFDGVHMGHKQVLAELRGHALAVRGPAVVMTFEPHPRALLYPDEEPRRLGHLHERLNLIKAAGIDAVLLMHFNLAMAAWTPEQFIRRLHNSISFHHMHVGYDFAFGHDRAGHTTDLRNLADTLGYTVSEAAAFEMQGGVVSSSRIRSTIESADFDLATNLLGRPFSISGHVGRGDGRGRQLGFPTANLELKKLAHPPPGIYAVLAECRGKVWNGAAYLGFRPTFAGRTMRLETHVLDDCPDFYKKRLTVTFVRRIREDRAFKGHADLANQIARDCQTAREILG